MVATLHKIERQTNLKLQIELLREIIKDSDRVHITMHMMTRFFERGIEYDDIIASINSGEIIEQYPDDYPYPSCLISGYSSTEQVLHTVCGTSGEDVWIISAYYPDNNRWSDDFKIRKEKKS